MEVLAARYAQNHSLSRATRQQIDTAVRHWQLYFVQRTPCSVTAIELAGFSMSLRLTEAAATVNKHRAHLRSILSWGHEMGLLPCEPYWLRWQKLPEPRRAPQAFTREEFHAGLEVARSWPGWISGVEASAWWESLLLSIWYSGARIGAVLAVPWSDVLLDRPGFYVRAEHQKQRTDQFFLVGQDCVAALQRAQSPRRTLVWPWPHRREALYRHIRRIFAQAGITLSRDAGGLFHRIRRSTASYIHAAGGNATSQLGHSCSSVTERYYDPRICGAHDATAFMPTLK